MTILNFKNLDDFHEWVYKKQKEGYNPVYRPIEKNTFKIIRLEKI